MASSTGSNEGTEADSSSTALSASTSAPLDEIFSLPINARILNIAVVPGQDAERLAVLTDHHSPRLFVLRFDAGSRQGPPSRDWAAHIVTEATLPLDELGRQPAESGFALSVERSSHDAFAFAHTHAGIIRVARVSGERQSGRSAQKTRSSSGSQKHRASISSVLSGDVREDGSDAASSSISAKLARAFTARLPHPHLISSSFIDRQDAISRPTIALLSLSSTTSRLPGLGMQCLPVLSFHEIVEQQAELRPVPWLSSRKSSQAPPSPVQERRTSTSNRRRSSRAVDFADAEDGTQTPRNQSSSQRAIPASARYGPAASGRTRTREQEDADDEALSKTALARAHVPIPFDDALGAHLIISLPARAGGGVIVFSETSILHVPPPGDMDAQLADPPRSPTTSSSIAGKRRKGSGTDVPAAAQQIAATGGGSAVTASGSALSTSPTATFAGARPPANENGKRRRSTASSNNANIVTSPSTRRRSSATSTRSTSSMRLLRAKLGGPAITVAATVISEPPSEDDGVLIDADGHGTVKVLFCTHAGRLNLLTVEMAQVDGSVSTRFSPTYLEVTQLGQVSAPGGSGALTYIGENFVHVASSSGDSMLVRIRQEQEMSDATVRGLDVIHRWPSLAPVLDFVVDDGAGNDPAQEGSGQARIITCSGSGPDGSLRIARNGVNMQEVLSIGEGGVRRIWSIKDKNNVTTRLLVLGYSSHTRLLAIGDGGITDATADYVTTAGLDCTSTTHDVAQIAPGVFTLINTSGVNVLSAESPQRLSSWASSSLEGKEKNVITSAAATSAGQALLGTQMGTVALLQASVDAVRLVKTAALPSEVSAISMLSAPLGGSASLAAIALWNPALVKLYALPDMKDVTPTPLQDAQPSLIRSISLHTFAVANRPITGPQLLLGLSSGSLVSMQLSLPSADSISKVIGVFEKRTAILGTQPLHLRPLATREGNHAVLATSDKATIVFSTGTTLTYSAMRHNDIADACAFTYTDEGGNLDIVGAFARPGEVALSKIGQIDNLDIVSVELDLDNPLALALCNRGTQAAVVTTAFLPEGRGTAPVAGGKVKLFDLQTLQLLHEHQLEDEERPSCIKYFERGDDKFVVVGTGYTFPDRSETHNGRINIFQILPDSDKFALAGSENVGGNVYDIEVLPGGNTLLAAINAEVKSFSIETEEEMSDNASFITATMHQDRDGAHATTELYLLSTGSWSCAFIATSLRLLDGNRILVGDALRSLVLLGIDGEGKLSEMARDCDPFWTVGCEVIDAENETYIGSDIAFNLFTCKRLKWSQSARDRLEQTRMRESETGGADAARSVGPVDTTWSHIMQREAAFHYGDLVNTMKRGSLVRSTGQVDGGKAGAMSGAEEISSPRIIFGTAAGAIGVIAKLGDRAGSILGQLSARLGDASTFAPIGGITNDDWRKLRTDHRTQAATGFVDGDALRAQYDALSADARAALLQSGNVPMTATVEEVNNVVEGIRRLS